MFSPVFMRSAAEPAQFPADSGLEVAVAGRSNSGKSTAINAIAGARKLARVSKTPGRTQLVNFFELAPGKRIVDLPGYGYARVPPRMQEDWQALIEAYLERGSLAGLFVTVDIRRGVLPPDEALLAYARRLNVPAVLLLTKCDKLSRAQTAAQQAKAAHAAAEIALPFSAPVKHGVDDARRQLVQWLEWDPEAAGEARKKETPGAGFRGRARGR